MPLLKKEPLERTPIPEDIKPDDEVFYCKTTNEVFTDYDKLFERVILCNSLVWTCSMTGKSGLTYQDAQASEEQAKELLATFPEALNRPLLYLCTLTNRRNLNDLVDDLFGHIKDKYFVGETVEAFSEPGNIKKAYKVLKVMLSNDNPSQKTPGKNGTPEKATKPLESDSFEYALQEICGQITSVRILKGSKLSRKKGKFTREKCKLFLKMNCEADPSQHVWKAKESSMKKYRISAMTYDSIAPGPMPTFEVSESRKVEKEGDNVIDLTSEEQNAPKQKKTSNNKDSSDPQKVQEARVKAQKDMQRVEEDLKNMRALAEEKRLKKIQEKEEQKKKAELEKAKKLEEKKKEKEMKKLQAVELNTPKEDLECDDLKDLPTAIPVHCSNLSMQCFGDLVFVQEFILAFQSILDLDIPRNFNLEKLLKALTSSDTNGHFSKILLSFVSSLLENSKEFEKQTNTEDGKVDQDSAEAVHSKASKQAVAAYGASMNDLQLDQFTVSEVLRMYLKCLPFNHLVNDNFQNSESLVEELELKSVFEISAENKLQMLCMLCHQLVSCNVMKTTIEENFEKLKVAQKNLKNHQISCMRREKDEIQYWTKKKQEQRLKNLLTGEAKTNSDDNNSKNDDPNSRKSNRVVQTIPDENFEKLPMDNIDWEKISDSEKQQMKMWERRKEEGLAKEVSELLMGCPIVLGFDRTHRQYWKFTSLPGVFVEDYEDDISGFKFMSPVKSRIMSPSRKKKEDEQKVTMDGKSNKENIPADAVTLSRCKTMTVQEQLASKGSTRWTFYNQVEQIDLLIQNLNVWGIRENQLLFNLKENYNSIVDGLKDAEAVDKMFAQLTRRDNQETVSSEEEEEETQESEMEANLAEYILDLEERIFAGALGRLKNVDRIRWRQALEDGDYESSDLSCDGHHKKDATALDGLSSALIQVERMVEDRFIDLLLGRKDKKSKQKQKKKEKEVEDSDDDASSTSSHVTRSASIDKWEANTRSATNLSQLFLLMSIVENSITWSKSALNARCCICRRKGDGENMLLCDGCDKGHHTYCLKPVVKNIPEGDWYCPKCRSERPKPKVAPKKVEAKGHEEDDETKDYEDFEQSGTEDESNSEEDKKVAKQELLEKRFYGKTQADSKTQPAPKVAKTSKNTRKKSSLGAKQTKRKHEEDEEEDDHTPEVKRDKRKKLNDDQLGPIDMKMCESLVSDLMADENAWPFLRPVSKKDAPDYFDIIKTPMDFSTIRNKIHNFHYDRPDEIIDDVRLIFNNCRTYNKQTSVFYVAAETLSDVFQKRLNELGSSATNNGKVSRKDSTRSNGGASKKRTRVVVDSDSESEEFQPRTLRKRTL